MPYTNLSGAALYGKGIFTTVAIRDGKPFLWEKHWHRIVSNAAALDIDVSTLTRSEALALLLKAVTDARLKDGRARVTLSDESPSRIWSEDNPKTTGLSIIVAERRSIPGNLILTISPHRINTTSPLVGIKSCNYLEHLIAYEEAAERGFHEAIRLNESGEVASACMSNVFWEKDGKLFTPSLKTGCLPGTTREFVMENLECEEVAAGIEALESSDRIFLTSAGIGVVTVAEFEGRSLNTSEHRLEKLLPF